MKPYLISFAIFLFLIHAAPCQIIKDPVADYLSRHADLPTGELFPGEPWKGRADVQPPGGYLLRFEAPIGVNGAEVTFIASSILADMRNSSWCAYTKSKGKAYAFAGEVGFGCNPRFYLLSPQTNGFLGLAEISVGKRQFYVGTYFLRKNGQIQLGDLGGIPRDQDKEYDDPHFADVETSELLKTDKLSQEFVPNIRKILLGEYLKNPSVKWRPFNATFDVESQGADPADHDAVRQNGLEEGEAAQLFKSLQK